MALLITTSAIDFSDSYHRILINACFSSNNIVRQWVFWFDGQTNMLYYSCVKKSGSSCGGPDKTDDGNILVFCNGIMHNNYIGIKLEVESGMYEN